MESRSDQAERLLLFAGGALLLVALFGPLLPGPAHAHAFADQRTLWGIPHALDVLSNLPFALAGLLGLRTLRRVHVMELSGVQRRCARLFFVGLLLTAFGSSWYHLHPDDLGLAIDRGAMGVAFAGLLGLAAAAHVSDRAGRLLAGAVLMAAPASVLAWLFLDNVLPWAVVQFGGMAILLVLAATHPRAGELAVRWWWVLAAYGVAKAFEAADHMVYEASGELLSGHTLKHLTAAGAAWPAIAALRERTQGQNARKRKCAQPARPKGSA